MNNLRIEYGNHTISPVRMKEFSHTLSAWQSLALPAANDGFEPILPNPATWTTVGFIGRLLIVDYW
jgi:hypothetical protein